MRSNPGVIYSKPLSQTTATTKTDDKSEGQPAVVAQALIPAFERPMPENSCEFKVSLGHTVSSDQPVLQTETLCCVLRGVGGWGKRLVVVCTVISVLWRGCKEDQELKVILSYMASS